MLQRGCAFIPAHCPPHPIKPPPVALGPQLDSLRSDHRVIIAGRGRSTQSRGVRHGSFGFWTTAARGAARRAIQPCGREVIGVSGCPAERRGCGSPSTRART